MICLTTQGIEAIEGLDEDDPYLAAMRDSDKELWDWEHDADAERVETAEGRHVLSETLLAAAFAQLATDEAREFFLDRATYFGRLAAGHVPEMVAAARRLQPEPGATASLR